MNWSRARSEHGKALSDVLPLPAINRLEETVALAQRAMTPLPPGLTYGNPPIPAVITCHIAVWFWAAQEAQARGLTNAKAPTATLQRIVAMPGGPQNALMALPHAGMVQYAGPVLPPLPPPGTVLRWATGATHSAIVTGLDAITGYNQGQQFVTAIGQPGRTVCQRAAMAPGHVACYMIDENTVVNAAGAVFNL
jgi:hypothetical protein